MFKIRQTNKQACRGRRDVDIFLEEWLDMVSLFFPESSHILASLKGGLGLRWSPWPRARFKRRLRVLVVWIQRAMGVQPCKAFLVLGHVFSVSVVRVNGIVWGNCSLFESCWLISKESKLLESSQA